jgi:transcriptional regulator with XRE-family HTH domain
VSQQAGKPNQLFRQARYGLKLTRKQLADEVNQHLPAGNTIDATDIGRIERGQVTWPRADRREAFRMVLGVTSDSAIGLVNTRSIFVNKARDSEQKDSILSISSSGSHASPATVGRSENFSVRFPLLESPWEILERLDTEADCPRQVKLEILDLCVEDVVERYESEGPGKLAPLVVQQRRRLQNLLSEATDPELIKTATRIAAQLSGQLCYMGVNLGIFGSAKAYGIEAFALADRIGDSDLKAWIRGTQSFAAFYSGNYRQALMFADDGRRYAGTGPQAVRLAINGQARALGKLGERTLVDRRVGESFEMLGDLPIEFGMSPCISFGTYSEARVASNAATAYLPLGAAKQALEYANLAAAIADGSPSKWSQALVRIDMATACLQQQPLDIEQAILLGREAMSIATYCRIESISQRLRALAFGLQPWSNLRIVADFLEEVAAWANGESLVVASFS